MIGRRLIIAGGQSGDSTVKTVNFIDIDIRQHIEGPEMLMPRENLNVGEGANRRVLAIGGRNREDDTQPYITMKSIEEFLPARNTWKLLGMSLNTNPSQHSAVKHRVTGYRTPVTAL